MEYVRSKANVADAPSRVDLSGCEWDCGLPGAGLVSRPVPCVLPQARVWSDTAASWALYAQEAATAAREGDGEVP